MDLTPLSTDELECFYRAIAGRRLSFPLSRFALRSEGLEHAAEASAALSELGEGAALAIIAAVIAERREFVGGGWFSRIV